MDAGGNYRCFGEQLAPEFDKTQKVSVIVGNFVRRIKAVMKKPLTVKNEEFCCSGGGAATTIYTGMGCAIFAMPFLGRK